MFDDLWFVFKDYVLWCKRRLAVLVFGSAACCMVPFVSVCLGYFGESFFNINRGAPFAVFLRKTTPPPLHDIFTEVLPSATQVGARLSSECWIAEDADIFDLQQNRTPRIIPSQRCRKHVTRESRGKQTTTFCVGFQPMTPRGRQSSAVQPTPSTFVAKLFRDENSSIFLDEGQKTATVSSTPLNNTAVQDASERQPTRFRIFVPECTLAQQQVRR